MKHLAETVQVLVAAIASVIVIFLGLAFAAAPFILIGYLLWLQTK